MKKWNAQREIRKDSDGHAKEKIAKNSDSFEGYNYSVIKLK